MAGVAFLPGGRLDTALLAALRGLGVGEAELATAARRADLSKASLYRILTTGPAGLSDHLMGRVVAAALGVPFLREPQIAIDPERFAGEPPDGGWLGTVVPVILPDGGRGEAIVCREDAVRDVARSAGAGTRPAIVTRQALTSAIVRDAGTPIAVAATSRLAAARPGLCAAEGLVAWQRATLVLAALLTGTGFLLAPAWTALAGGILLGCFFLGHTLLRSYAAMRGVTRLAAGRLRLAPPRHRLTDAELPRYTVLIPLHREAALLPHIAAVVAGLDYPADKLDVKLLLESTDEETVAAAFGIRWPSHVTIVRTPDIGPKTKPKALNVALPLASGELIVVYDAEDDPAPDQLRIAAETFAAAPPEVAVLQARLSFFNRTETWLARQFAIEYAAHFGFLLPALERLGIPIPLGGTSNHIRIDILRRLDGWDAWNVTEDADLGLRFHALGFRTRMIDSVTDEEAACHWRTWRGQRTRWQKGWMQTYAVHMRRPFRLLRTLGLFRFVGFQLMIGGQIVSPLAHAGFLAVAICGLWQGWLFDFFADSTARWTAGIAAFNLVAGYGASLALGLAAVRGEGWDGMRRHVFLMPAYWLAISVAGLCAVRELFTAPFHWEKTRHGISGIQRSRPNRHAAGSGPPAG